MADLRLSVLDQSPISEGSTGAHGLRNMLALARLADELGYRRYERIAEAFGWRGLPRPCNGTCRPERNQG